MTRMDLYGAMMAFAFVFSLVNMMDRAWLSCAVWLTIMFWAVVLMINEA